jgi:glycosyltransferase involved in cell wall biosynthesis
MRIAIVTETFPPEVNGVAMTFGIIAEELGRRGNHITVYRPRIKESIECPRNSYLRIIAMPGFGVPGYREIRMGFPAAGKLRGIWCKERPDLVHVVTEGPLGASAISAARTLGIPVTSSFHTNFHSYTGHYGFRPLNRLILWWLRRVHNRSVRTFVPTTALSNELKSSGFERLGLLSRGVDLGKFNPRRRSQELRDRWGAKDGKSVVLHVGRMAPEKNYPLLFRCFDVMKQVNPSLLFVLAGEGPLRKSLIREHPEYFFLGFLSREEIGNVFASADLYIHASSTETFGNVLTEAMASGLAIAGFDYAAARQFITDGENGLTVPLGDEYGLLEASKRLASDPLLVSRLGSAAPLAVADQSWERVTERFEEDLRAIAGKDGK